MVVDGGVSLRHLETEERPERVLRAKAKAVRRAMAVPRLPRTRGVWAVGMVRNEADIIEAMLTHAFEQGVARALIADNGSTDNTLEILREMAKHYPLSVARDSYQAYEQSLKTTYMARLAARHGATWVVPMDADEFWSAPGGRLAEYLEASTADIEEAPIHNAFPLASMTSVSRSDRFRFDLTPSALKKVAVRADRLMEIETGNHSAVSGASVVHGGGLRVTHVPWRSLEQFAGKVAVGKVAIEKANDDPGSGWHWRALGGYAPDHLRDIWDGLLRGEGGSELCWYPVGPFHLGSLPVFASVSNLEELSVEEPAVVAEPETAALSDSEEVEAQPLEQPWSARRLNALLSRMSGHTSYLEIGVDRGETFGSVQADMRIGVDPDPQFSLDDLPDDAGFFVGSSDDFFAGLHREVRFDVVFIDGLHEFEQTYQDLINALHRVGEHGAILIDDTVPCDAISAIPDQEASFDVRWSLGDPGLPWHGDVWKVVAVIAEGHPNLDYRTIVSSGNPQTLVWRRRGPLVEERFNEDLVDRIFDLSYDDVFDDRSLPAFLRATTESDALACWAER